MTEPMRDHWWWRPGWRVGRAYYTWHLTFEHAPEVHRVAAEHAAALDVPGLDVVPARWLHLTMQGIGFTDELPAHRVDAIADAARDRLVGHPPFDLTLGPAAVYPEGVALAAEPAEPVARLRVALRAAIADVRGPGGVPGDEDGFHPHVSVAYSNAAGPAEPIRAALAHPAPGTTRITEAHLIALDRDHREYRWTTHAAVPLPP